MSASSTTPSQTIAQVRTALAVIETTLDNKSAQLPIAQRVHLSQQRDALQLEVEKREFECECDLSTTAVNQYEAKLLAADTGRKQEYQTPLQRYNSKKALAKAEAAGDAELPTMRANYRAQLSAQDALISRIASGEI